MFFSINHVVDTYLNKYTQHNSKKEHGKLSRNYLLSFLILDYSNTCLSFSKGFLQLVGAYKLFLSFSCRVGTMMVMVRHSLIQIFLQTVHKPSKTMAILIKCLSSLLHNKQILKHSFHSSLTNTINANYVTVLP